MPRRDVAREGFGSEFGGNHRAAVGVSSDLLFLVVVVPDVLRADVLQEVVALQHDGVVASGLRGRDCHLGAVGYGHG